MTKETERVVPVAYVTKWATTRGITVIRDGTEKSGGIYSDRYLLKRHVFVASRHWTEDREIAIERWRSAVKKKATALSKQAKAMAANAEGEPVFDGEDKP